MTAEKTAEINSSDNSNFKRWKSLLESRGIKKHQQCLISGAKIVAEQLTTAISDYEMILSKEDDAPSEFPGKVYKLPPLLFNQLDIFSTHKPLLIRPLPLIKTWSADAEINGLKLICPLGDPANLGAIIRTASALNCSAIILAQEAANPFLPKSIRSSAGSIFKAPLLLGPQLQDFINLPLKNLFALDVQGETLQTFQWPESTYLIVGEEGPGLPTNDLQCLRIDIDKNVESLNAVVAASLAIYSFNMRQKF